MRCNDMLHAHRRLDTFEGKLACSLRACLSARIAKEFELILLRFSVLPVRIVHTYTSKKQEDP